MLKKIGLAGLAFSAALATASAATPAPVPGDDFFAYANADWLAQTAVPAGKKRYGARDEINAAVKRQVAELITRVAANPGAQGQKVANFYAAYFDEAAIDKRGMAALSGQLAALARLSDKTALAKWLGSHVPVDVDPIDRGLYVSAHLFGLSVQHGIHGETTHFAYLVQGGLGLPEREQYLSDAPAMKDVRSRYQLYIAHLLEVAGYDRTTERAAAVLALETAIARSHATAEESANDHNADQRWARAEFVTQAPGMDWPAFFTAAGLAGQKYLIAWQPQAIRGTAALIGSQPLGVWQDYLRFHMIDRYAEVLPHPLADLAQAFHGPETTPAMDRAQRAIDATNRFLPLAVGRLYVEKYFPPAAKAKAQTIVANVTAAFRHRLASASWMTPASRKLALAKLDTLYFGVGYPDKWPDDAGLVLKADDAVGNLTRIEEWNRSRALAKLAIPVDRYEWYIDPQTSIAVLDFLGNSYNFSAALLQPPKFDPAASDATNYGAIGAMFGHEISHFVDTLGADYNAQGGYDHWWTAADSAQYDKVCAPLVDQFAGYRPFADLAIDGKLTLSENLADLGGINAAFDAYRTALGAKPIGSQALLAQDREFFLGFARNFRVRFTEEGLRAQSTHNDHAPEMFRVSTVRNLDAWYEAFDVKPGERLYLDPQARVHIW